MRLDSRDIDRRRPVYVKELQNVQNSSNEQRNKHRVLNITVSILFAFKNKFHVTVIQYFKYFNFISPLSIFETIPIIGAHIFGVLLYHFHETDFVLLHLYPLVYKYICITLFKVNVMK